MIEYKQAELNIIHEKKVADNLLDTTQTDLNYIVNNPELLAKHFKYIDQMMYLNAKLKVGSHVIASDGTLVNVKSFMTFKERYKPIHDRWLRLLRCCYDPSHVHYAYFGGRGIKISKEFLDSKFFCKWCLQQKLVDTYGSYTRYMIRNDKLKEYSPDNCFTATEKEIHESKSLKIALMNVFLAKKYDEGHHKSVSFINARTRYFVFDLFIDDALNIVYDVSATGYKASIKKLAFSPIEFYKSVADENSVSEKTYTMRVCYAYLSDLKMRPYEMLKPEFDIGKAANAENKLSYKQQYHRMKKEQNKKVFFKTEDHISKEETNSVYNNVNDLNVYS